MAADLFAAADEILARNAPAAQPKSPEGVGDALRKGFDSGVYNAGANLQQIAGLGGEAAGFTDFARERYAKAKGLREQAFEFAPETQTIDQVKDLRSGANFLAGQVGGMAPTLGVAVAGGLLTKNPLVGGTAALTPLEAGDVAARQEKLGEPALDRFGRAVAGGAVSAVAQNVLPASVAGKVAGKTAAKGFVDNVVHGATVNAAAGAGSEAVKQVAANPDKPLNVGQIEEAGITGGVVGGVVGAGGGAIDAVRGKIPEKAASAPEAKAPAPEVKPEPAKPASLWDDVSGLVQKGREAVDNSVDRVMSGQPLGDLKEFATAAGDKLRGMADLSDNQTAQKAKAWGEQMLADAGLTPEKKAAVKEAMTAGNPVAMATLKKAYDMGQQAVGRVQSFVASIKPADTTQPGVKRSNDFSGAVKAIVEDIVPLLQRSQPHLLDNAAAINRLADGLREVVHQLPRGPLPSDTIAKMIDVLGPDTVNVLTKINGRFGKLDPAQTEAFFTQLKAIHDVQQRRGGLTDLVRESLTPEAQNTVLASDVPGLVDQLTRIARGELDRPGKSTAQDDMAKIQFQEFMKEHFGDAADAVSKAVEKEAKLGLKEDALAAEAHPAAEIMDEIRVAQNKKGEPLMHPELFTANKEPGQNYAKQYMSDLQAKYPDRNVKFEYTEGSKTHGEVVAEKAADPDALTEADLRGMRLDTKKYPNSPNKLKLGDEAYDYQRIARVMDRKLPYEADGQDRSTRLARSFMAGVARLHEQYGAFDIPDKAVIGQVAGKPFTFGEARHLDPRTTSDIIYDAQTRELENARKTYKATDNASTREKIRAEAEKVVEERNKAKDTELTKEPHDTGSEDGLAKTGKDGQIHAAAKDNSPGELVQRSNEDGSPHSVKDTASEPRNELIATVSTWGGAVGRRGQVLLANFDKMGKLDRQRMLSLAGQEASAASDVINTLARKYKDVIVVPEGKASEPVRTMNPRELQTESLTSDRAFSKMTELVKDPNVAYGLTTKSAQMASGPASDPATRAAVEAHVAKVLAGSVKTEWANLTHAGEFVRANIQDVIRLSVHALDPMSTSFHESLHGFVAQLKDAGAHDVVDVLQRAAESPHVLAQLTERFKNDAGVLKQLADPEERAAYMYQMWAADPTFKVSPAGNSVMQKIAKFIRNLLGTWSNDERALHIMEYFNSGEFGKNIGDMGAVRRALMDTHRSQALEAAKEFTKPLAKLADSVVATGSARLRDTGIPSFQKLADTLKREHTAEGGDQGFIPAARVEATKRRTALAEATAGFSHEQLQEAMEGLQRGVSPASAEARLAAGKIKALLQDARTYMVRAGVDIGNLGPDYFPRVWDTHYISQHQKAFRDMLEPYIRSGEFKGSVGDFMRNLINRGGNEFGIETREPGMQFKKERVLAFIKHQDAAEFLNKDLMGTMGSYLNQAARRAEWSRRLGGGKLERLFENAKKEGATPEHLAVAERYLKGVDGTLGDTMDPTMRRLMGNMIVYQNVRLLPLAMFSSIIDPVGVAVRGGSVKDAWNTFTRGMAEIPESFGRKGSTTDRATQWAELVGAVDSAMLSHTMGDIYTQGMVGGTAQKINNTFFKYNMMEGLNRSFRIGATEAAMNFIVKHAEDENHHSPRFMRELGLDKADVKLNKDGHLALTEAEGLTPEQVTKVHLAINQWVDGAVLRPDAADKPIWMNDPRFALLAHLKQFVYSFQKTILERVGHELKHGNYQPAMALATYVPVMMAADFAKGLITTGGGTPDWQKGWGPEDYVGYGVQRAGLLGVGQFGLDIAKDVQRGGAGFGALAGPTLEQFSDVVQTLGGHKQFGPTVLKAMPANALYSHSLGHDEAGPMFAD